MSKQLTRVARLSFRRHGYGIQYADGIMTTIGLGGGSKHERRCNRTHRSESDNSDPQPPSHAPTVSEVVTPR